MSKLDYYSSMIEQNSIPCSIEQGIDGKFYAVFPNNFCAEEYQEYFDDCQISCFDQYDNAYLIGEHHET